MKINQALLDEWGACESGRQWFRAQPKRDGRAVVSALMADGENEKLQWANWLIVRIMDKKKRVQYAIYAAEQVIGIFEKKYPDDKRPRKAIEAAKAWVKSPTEKNRANAAAAAANATAAAANATAANAANADAAADAAYAAANAANAAADAANATARKAMRLRILKYGLTLLKGAK